MDYDEIIAKGREQDIVCFKRYGSYQGEWILLTKDNENYYIYRDWYGSCSLCDALESWEAEWEEANNYKQYEWTKERCKEFAKEYRPFLTIPEDQFKYIIKHEDLNLIMPANIPEYYNNELEEWQKEIERKFK